jgi:hypothetical protein
MWTLPHGRACLSFWKPKNPWTNDFVKSECTFMVRQRVGPTRSSCICSRHRLFSFVPMSRHQAIRKHPWVPPWVWTGNTREYPRGYGLFLDSQLDSRRVHAPGFWCCARPSDLICARRWIDSGVENIYATVASDRTGPCAASPISEGNLGTRITIRLLAGHGIDTRLDATGIDLVVSQKYPFPWSGSRSPMPTVPAFVIIVDRNSSYFNDFGASTAPRPA